MNSKESSVSGFRILETIGDDLHGSSCVKKIKKIWH
jgi:hypothetical protein